MRIKRGKKEQKTVSVIKKNIKKMGEIVNKKEKNKRTGKKDRYI